jgi:glycosyltransferase involved in cell wall biosynthesis
MSFNSLRPNASRLLLIGPEPPPWNGTTVKFGIFHAYARECLGQDAVAVIDAQIGDKSATAITPALSLSGLKGYSRILIQSLLKARAADVIVIFGSQRFATLFGSLASGIFSLLGKRVYISLFGGGYDTYLRLLRPFVRRFVGLLLRRSTGIIVETRHLKHALANLLPAKLYYVPNFRRPTPAHHNCRSNPSRIVRFLYAGVICRDKGIGELLEAFSCLMRHVEDGTLSSAITLDLYGPLYNNPKEPLDLELAEQLPSIRIHGEVTHAEIMRAYANTDVFVFPSYSPTEGHSGAVIEAVMHGLPVIAADWRATSELVQDKVNGLLCAPRDSIALAECMERLVRDESLRLRLAEGAKLSAVEFDAERACAGMLKTIMT